MTDEVIERAGFVLGRQPRLLDVALDQPALLQRTADAHRDLLDQPLQFLRTRLAHRTEHRRCEALDPIHAIQK